jgi:hypothetical protein
VPAYIVILPSLFSLMNAGHKSVGISCKTPFMGFMMCPFLCWAYIGGPDQIQSILAHW